MDDIYEVTSALSDKTRLRLINIVREEGPLSSKRAHNEFISRYEDRRRESIYKALETLVDANILTKTYEREGEGLVYELPNTRLIIDLSEMKVQPDN